MGAALLRQVGGGEIDGDVLEGQAEANGVECIADGPTMASTCWPPEMRTCTSTGLASMPTKAKVAICPYMAAPRWAARGEPPLLAQPYWRAREASRTN